MSWPEKGGTGTPPSYRPRRHYWNRYRDLPSLLSNSSTSPFLALVVWYSGVTPASVWPGRHFLQSFPAAMAAMRLSWQRLSSKSLAIIAQCCGYGKTCQLRNPFEPFVSGGGNKQQSYGVVAIVFPLFRSGGSVASREPKKSQPRKIHSQDEGRAKSAPGKQKPRTP
jgi:hypothetical protein